MSSKHLTFIAQLFVLLLLLLQLVHAEKSPRFFSKSSYDIWCQENLLSPSLFLYPDPIPIGIARTPTIKSVTYQLIDPSNSALLHVKSRRLADFYFLHFNLSRPLEINREYQDLYHYEIQATIITSEGNFSETVQLRLHVADSNDNDGVFDTDFYQQNYSSIEKTLIQLHASDADQIQNAQIFYELASSLNETFTLHPLTGQLYLVDQTSLQPIYQFDVYAYDRSRKRFVDNNMKTKTHVRLEFHLPIKEKTKGISLRTMFNETIDVAELIETVPIELIEHEHIDLNNLHRPILTLDFPSNISGEEIFLLNNSSSNVKENLFLYQRSIYFDRYVLEEYHLEFLICFAEQRCQTKHCRYLPSMISNISNYQFLPIDPIEIDDDLPVDSFLTRFQLKTFDDSVNIRYKLLHEEKHIQFYLHPQTGVLRLAERLTSSFYRLEIQANIQIFNRRYAIETTLDLHVREVNKHRPKFVNATATELVQLPYQFRAIDLDENRTNNARISFRLGRCAIDCPFQIDPNNGTLTIRDRTRIATDPDGIFHFDVIAFDWGEPISLASRLAIRVDLSSSSRLNKRDLLRTRSYSRKWKKKFTSSPSNLSSIAPSPVSSIESKTIFLNIGFRRDRIRYDLEERSAVPLIIDRLEIAHEGFPWTIDDQRENLFFYMINDTNVPFIIDQKSKELILIGELDRETKSEFTFEIALKFKSIYAMKFQDDEPTELNFQYTSKYSQKLLVEVRVHDVNDHRPSCSIRHHRLTLNENEKKMNLYRVQAIDEDLGENGTVMYSFVETHESFTIDPVTGQIDCVQPMDYEQISSIDLHVLASDQGKEVQYQSICMTIHIEILDENDNPPRFAQDFYRFQLFVDMPRYAIFDQIVAHDADRHSSLRYSLNANPYLTVDPISGHLRLKHYLYRLTDQIFNVTARVSDGLHTRQSIIFIDVQPFVDAQQPILLNEPALALTINQSYPVNQSIVNLFRRFQFVGSTIDAMELLTDGTPFRLDRQGNLRLSQSLISSKKTSFWLIFRLTRYRAVPAHCHFHLHLNIRSENLYLPQCRTLHQRVQVYDFAIQHPFARVQVSSTNKQSSIEYRLFSNNEQIFSIDERTGSLHLLPRVQNSPRLKSDYLLTIQALDLPSKLTVNCFVHVQLIRRRELIPRFLHGSNYQITLPELTERTGRLRQRLFQIVALLDHHVYDRKLEIRYRILGSNSHFIINRQTGYIAAKRPLNSYNTLEFTVEAFTVAHRDEIVADGNEQDEDETSNRSKGRIVSSRVTLPVQIRVVPSVSIDSTSISSVDSTINIDLLSSTEVGTTILHLGMNHRLTGNESQWFILIGHIHHTRYFHVQFQTGQLILLRPIDELINGTNPIELKINVTQDWIRMNTIKVLIRLIPQTTPSVSFAQTDYYSSVSKNIPIGVEIARLTIDHGYKDCRYSIETVEQIKSKELFRIDPQSGAVIVNKSLENLLQQNHLLTILYRCDYNYQMASTRLHIQILDETNSVNQTKKTYRFTRENYFVLFESSLIVNQRKTLMSFQLISDDFDSRTTSKSQAKILHGDPLNLFEIDREDQSLILRDESRVRSYVYPLVLTVVDQSFAETISCTVTIFITNIGIHFPCPTDFKASPYLFTYQSEPAQSIDLFSGQRLGPVQSVIVQAFDPFTPLNGQASNYAECSMNFPISTKNSSTRKIIDWNFEEKSYRGWINESFGSSSYIYNDHQEPIRFQLKPSSISVPSPFETSFHLINQSNVPSLFHLDPHAGLIKYHSFDRLASKYSLLILGKSSSSFSVAPLNIVVQRDGKPSARPSLQSIYEFRIYTPFVNNSTIGFLHPVRKNFTILNEQMQSMVQIDEHGRMFIRNRTSILTNGNFYDFLIQDEFDQIARIQISILSTSQSTFDCPWSPFEQVDDRALIGFVQSWNETEQRSKRRSTFTLENDQDRFRLDREHGLLIDLKPEEEGEYLLLIHIDQISCLLPLDRQKRKTIVPFPNATSMDLNRRHFTVNFTKDPSQSVIIVGRVFTNRSVLLYQLVHPHRHFSIHPDLGQLEFYPDVSFNRTEETLEVIAKDLISQQTSTINVTVHFHREEFPRFSSPIFSKTLFDVTPPGSRIFHYNSSGHYSLYRGDPTLFHVDPQSGDVTLLNYLSAPFYTVQMKISPSEDVAVVKFNVEQFNRNAPNFLHLPLNFSVDANDQFITKLSAYDPDFSDHPNLSYYLLDHQEFFTINASNGLILRTSTPLNESDLQLNIAVSDGLYLTKTSLHLHFHNYSAHAPKFSSASYSFVYHPSSPSIGSIVASDEDLHDRIIYHLHRAPNGIDLHPSTGRLTISPSLFFEPSIEFYASATDRADEIVYAKVSLQHAIEPRFSSNVFYVNLRSSELKIPMEIFRFYLVDAFNRSLSSAEFRLDNRSETFHIEQNKLILRQQILPMQTYRLKVTGAWKNFSCETSIEVRLSSTFIPVEQKFYRFTLEKESLTNHSLIHRFNLNNVHLSLIDSPLTRDECSENFALQNDHLIFLQRRSIVLHRCFFDIHFTDHLNVESIGVEIVLLDPPQAPIFSMNVYRFHIDQEEKDFRVFAFSVRPIRYQMTTNVDGVTLNQSTGQILLHSSIDAVRFTVIAIDEQTQLNASASVEFLSNPRKRFNLPNDLHDVPSCPNVPLNLSDQSFPGTVIQEIRQTNENSTSIDYYILQGDHFGFFSVNKLGQLYLTSSMLNRTRDNSFSLLILISSASNISFCRTTISIVHQPQWSHFICPPRPIRWTIEEESPIGSIIGTIRDLLITMNNGSDLIDLVHYRIDSEEFLINTTSGLITSNTRLDYEQKSSYTFSVRLDPLESNCSISIRLDLINLNDHPIVFDRTSLSYNITEHQSTPFYLGRMKFIDIDRVKPLHYQFFLINQTSLLHVDSNTGAILLQNELDREVHGPRLIFEVFARDIFHPETNLTGFLSLDINDLNDHGPKFSLLTVSLNISQSLRSGSTVFQVNATSADPDVNGHIRYSFVEPSEYFQIDEMNGMIRLKKTLPSSLSNVSLTIEAKEDGIDWTDRMNMVLSIVNDEKEYFNLDAMNRCSIEENQPSGTTICTIGKNSADFFYQFAQSNLFFELSDHNGTIVSKKVFDYEHDPHHYDLTIVVKDRENQSNILSSWNVTVSLVNINDHHPRVISENFSTLIYLYYPSINTVLHQIHVRDDDQSDVTFELINSTSPLLYTLHSTSNSTSLLLTQSIKEDHQDHLTIRIRDGISPSSNSIDVSMHLIYLQRMIELPQILPQTIDGYLNFDSNVSSINFGVLSVMNHSSYPLISFNLHPHEHFFLKTISSNQTELHFKPASFHGKSRLLHYQIQLTAIAFNSSDLPLFRSNQTKVYLPSTIQSTLKLHPIDIHLWSIDREMLDRTLSIVVNLQSQSTYDDFLSESLPMVREHLAQLIGVQLRHIHLYTFERKTSDRIELLLAIIRYPSRLKPSRYIHKKLIYNVLKNATDLFHRIPHIRSIEKILIGQCQMKSCENNGRCTSHLKLIDHQYEYFSSGHYQRLIPKYQWMVKCLCLNHFYGTRCQYKQDYSSPCASNPCSATERCIEESPTLYTCQCVDEPCATNEVLFEKSLDCINPNSPTCRDASNTLTFDGYSYVRMNVSVNFTEHINISFTFRTQVPQGKLLKLISKDEKDKSNILTIQIIDGHLNIELNEKILLEINEIHVHDGLWHQIDYSMDHSRSNDYSYYLLRLDHVFSHRFHLYQPSLSRRIEQIFIGNDFHGCFGNLTMNNQSLLLQKQSSSSSITGKSSVIRSMDHIGTNDGCQLTDMATRTLREYPNNEKKGGDQEGEDDLCALYHPCYHGGICTNHKNAHGHSFHCNCLKPRFAGRQCQLDLQPCLSNPCRYDQQCVSDGSTYDNRTYSCISSLIDLPMSTRNPLYIGLAVTFSTLILFILLFISFIIYCQNERKDQQRHDQFHHEKPLVSVPLLIQKSSPPTTTSDTTTHHPIESPMQTLLKFNPQGKSTVIETLALVDKTSPSNNFNEKTMNKSSISIDKQTPPKPECFTPHRRDSKGYSTIEQLNIPPNHFLVQYSSIDYDAPHHPLVDPSTTDRLEFPSSPTKYFNGHQENAANAYQVRINSLSDLTEKLAENNDLELTQSSNESSNNEQALLTSPVNTTERKRRSLFHSNGASSNQLRTSNSSLSKAPVYAKIIKTSSKPSNGGLSTIERLKLSGSPLRLLSSSSSSSPNYTRTTSFMKPTLTESPRHHPLSTTPENELLPSISQSKTGKTTPTSWKLNPRKLDSLKVRRNSRQMDEDDDDQISDDGQPSQQLMNDRSHLTTRTALQRLRHASESDLTHEHQQEKKNKKLSSFFQTEV